MLRVNDGGEHFRSIDCKVVKLQVDNMLHRTPHPVLIHSTVVTSADSPFCHIMYIEDLNNTSFDVPIVKKFQASLEVWPCHNCAATIAHVPLAHTF